MRWAQWSWWLKGGMLFIQGLSQSSLLDTIDITIVFCTLVAMTVTKATNISIVTAILTLQSTFHPWTKIVLSRGGTFSEA